MTSNRARRTVRVIGPIALFTGSLMPLQGMQEEPATQVVRGPPATLQDSIARSIGLFEELLDMESVITDLLAREATLSGEDSVLIAQRRGRRLDDQLQVVDAWVELVSRLDPSLPAVRSQLVEAQLTLTGAGAQLWSEKRDVEETIAIMRVPRDTLRGAPLLQHEKAIARRSRLLNTNAREFLELAGWFDALGLDPGTLRQEADSIVRARADDLSDRIEIVVELRRDLRQAIERAPETEAQALALDMLALEERLDNNTSSLQEMIQLLSGRGEETTGYRQLIITATGELTTDILDARVAFGLARDGMGAFRRWLVTDGVQWLFRLILFALIIALSLLGARVVRWMVHRSFDRAPVEPSRLLRETVLSLSGKAVIFLGFVIGLTQMGVQFGHMLAGLGVAGFIVGFALQETLSNFAAGFMIVVYEPYDVGDLIEVAGARGKVDGMTLVATSIKTVDNQLLVIPNSKIWGDVIRNVTAQRVRRVDLTFGVAYDADLDEAERVLTQLVDGHEFVLPEPEPVIKVHELADSAVVFIVRPWCRTENYWDVYWDITRAAKVAFDDAGIGIPFPHREVHVRMIDEGTPEQPAE